MSDSWLDVGHGDGQQLAPVSASRPSTTSPMSGQGPQSSRTGRIVVAAIAAMALAGSSGTAFAIRETLFPSIGAPTPRSVWQNPVPADESIDVEVSPSTSTPSTTIPTRVPTTTLVPEASNAGSVEIPPVISRDDSDHARSNAGDSDDSGPRPEESISDNSGSGSDDSGSQDSGADSGHSGSGAAVDDSSGSGSGDSSGSGSQDSSGSGKDSGDSSHSGSGRDDKPED